MSSETPYDALIFDLDGTLWDTTKPVTRAWNEVALERADLPSVTEAQVQSVMGLPPLEAIQQLLGGQDPSKVKEAAAAFQEREIALLRDTYLYPGVSTGLAELAKHYPLYLVSNCEVEYLARFFEITGLKKLFRDSECLGNTGEPKAYNISMVCRRNKVSRGVYVGDTAGDQIAARAAGVDFYFAQYGFGSPAQECPGFDSFGKLTEFFRSLKS